MQEARTITVMTGRTQTELEVSEIHYVLMNRNYADIHMEWGGVCKARITFEELVKENPFIADLALTPNTVIFIRK